MKHKVLYVPEDCVSALVDTLEQRIAVLQVHRESVSHHGGPSNREENLQQQQQIREILSDKIANLTMLKDRLEEAPLQ